MGVRGAMERAVMLVKRTKKPWVNITAAFHVRDQFFEVQRQSRKLVFALWRGRRGRPYQWIVDARSRLRHQDGGIGGVVCVDEMHTADVCH